jgi:uncharacterized surface protein with fasciclin (FAS1) repeats
MQDIYDVIAADKRMKKLHHYLETAGMGRLLQKAGPFTLFAPDDAAFGRMNIEEQIHGHDELRSTLSYHVVPGRYASADLLRAGFMKLETENGKTLTVSLEEGAAVIDNAKLVRADIECSNGVIHVIDNVFQPRLSGWYAYEYG